MLTLVKSFSLVLLLLPPTSIAALDDAIVSYVLEPFEWIGDDWFMNNPNDFATLNLSVTNESVSHGSGALMIEYEFQVDNNDNEKLDNVEIVDFGGVLRTQQNYNCYGATHVSIWYKIIQSRNVLMDDISLRLVLLEASNCTENCTNMDNLEQFYSFHDSLHVAQNGSNNDTEWHEIQVELRGGTDPISPLWLSGWKGMMGNSKLDLQELVGWRVEVLMDGIVVAPSTGETVEPRNIVLFFDQLSCIGGGSLLGSPFHTPNSYEDESGHGKNWEDIFFLSEISRNRSTITLEDGSLMMNYTVGQVKSWGGYDMFRFWTAGRGYYNLSQAAAVSFHYDLLQPASVSDRVHFRFILLDVSDAEMQEDFEFYHAFHKILDAGGPSSGTLTTELIGNEDSSSPFWLPGWGGLMGNRVLDKDHIKAISMQISLSGVEDGIGSLVSGALKVSNVAALASVPNDGDTVSRCITEDNINFFDGRQYYQHEKFLGAKCCEACLDDPTCIYGQSTEHCLKASFIEADDIYLPTLATQSKSVTFWVDDTAKRGDFCDRCECREDDRTIDCSGRNLTIVPKSFSPSSTLDTTEDRWLPLVLDLRGNPDLTLIGSNALKNVEKELEELILPAQLRYLAPDNLQNMMRLREVRFEPITDGEHQTSNVIMSSSELFSDVCCERGLTISLTESTEVATFCDMSMRTPGGDSVLEPFVEYLFATRLEEVLPGSIMSEGSESPEKCAEYCSIRSGCNYFTYDARLLEPACYLLADSGKPIMECCNYLDYAFDSDTLPRWTSGRVPRSRRAVDNARVLIMPETSLLVDQSSGYSTSFVVGLGSMPLQGAVWIEPQADSTNDAVLEFSPQQVVLYDNTTTATIKVTVSNSERLSSGGTIVVRNVITSCDSAFAGAEDPDSEHAVYIDVVVPSQDISGISMRAWVAMASVVMLAVAFIYMDNRRRLAESVWRVKSSELESNNPPTIIGQGAFGLVALAEYRGTRVAVKRVIPPRSFNSIKPDQDSTDAYSTIKLMASYQGQHDSLLSSGSRSLNSQLVNFDGVDLEGGHQTNARTARFNRRMPSSLASMCASCLGRDEYSRLKANFLEEMRYLSKLRHPCITTVMGAVVERSQEPMLVMEYMENGSLYDLVHNETMVVDGEYILPILRDLAQGLRFLHASTPQVIHGDLKAANVLIDSRFRAKVSDFGLTQKKRLGVTGTPYWMAPELLSGESKNTAASDMYSFGVVLFEVYSRRDPYEGEDCMEVLRLVADPLVEKRPRIPECCPPAVVSIMADCFSSVPSCRPTFEGIDNQLKEITVLDAEPESPALSHLQWKQKKKPTLSEAFPPHVAQAFRDGRTVEADSYDMVTILFASVVGLDEMLSTLPTIKASRMLELLHRKFDSISRVHDVFKITTVGDSWMGATNMIKDQPDHAKRMALFCLDVLKAGSETLVDPENPDRGCVNLKVAFHSGPVVANVVGSHNPRYCLFGDTVDTVPRMASSPMKNMVTLSKASAKLLHQHHPEVKIQSRGTMKVKGKGQIEMFCIEQEEQHNVSSDIDGAVESDIGLGRTNEDAHRVLCCKDGTSELDHLITTTEYLAFS